MQRLLIVFALLASDALATETPGSAALPPNGVTPPTVAPSLVGDRVEYICGFTTVDSSPGGSAVSLGPNQVLGIAMGEQFTVSAGPASGPGGQWVQLDMSQTKPGAKGWVPLKCVKILLNKNVHVHPQVIAPQPTASSH